MMVITLTRIWWSRWRWWWLHLQEYYKVDDDDDLHIHEYAKVDDDYTYMNMIK